MSTAPLPESQENRARWRDMPARRSMVEVGPYRIHTVEFGEVGAEPLVLLHGLSGSSRWWKRNVLSFARDFRVVVPDLIGFGRTRIRGPFPGIPRIAELLAEWMGTLGLSPGYVVGHSMGGQIAIHLAARFPEQVNELVLVDAAGIPRPLTPRAVLRFAAEVAPPSRWGDPAFVPVIVGDTLMAGVGTVLRGLVHCLREDVRPLLPCITARTLVVWGERDTIVPLAHAREIRAAIPGARLVVLPRAAHNPMVDRPAEFNRVVRCFLKGERVGE